MSRQILRGKFLTLALAVLVASTGLGADKCNLPKQVCPCGVRLAADGSLGCVSCPTASTPTASMSPAPPSPITTPPSAEPPVTTLPSSPGTAVVRVDCPSVPAEVKPDQPGCVKDESRWSREYNAAIDEVCAAHGLSGCSGGGVLWTLPWKDYVKELQARLLTNGFCSGHDYDNGDRDPEPGTNPSPAGRGFGSEMGIRLTGTTAREEYFAPLSTARKIRPAPGAYTGSCSPAVEPFPFRPETTETSPLPAPAAPAASSCLLPKGEGRWVEAAIGNMGHPPTSQQISVSTKWCSEVDPRDPSTGRISPPGWPFTGLGGSCGTKCCRIGTHEGDLGIACEAERFGTPSWSVVAGDARLVAMDNLFNVKVAEGTGRVRVCGSAEPTVCAEAAVRAQTGPVVGQ